jgi:hypothetical protein
VTRRLLAIVRAEARLVERLEKLEPRLDSGDSACWTEYSNLATALAAIAPQLRPEVIAPVVTQQELAERLGVSTRTIRRRKLQPKRIAIVKSAAR